MVAIPWPLSNSPGEEPQEGAGKLINIFAEPRGEESGPVWRRSPGATVFARTPSVGAAAGSAVALARGQNLMSTFFELVGSSTSLNAGSTAYTVNYPTNTEAGDIVFLLNGADSVLMPTTPTGFTELGTSTDFTRSSLMWKASTGETSVSLASFTTTAAVTLAFAIRGAMTTAPICDTGTMSTGASGDPDPGNITLTTADGLAVAVGWLDDDAVTSSTAPTSFGNVLFAVSTGADGVSAASVMVAFQPRPTTGSVTVSSFATPGDDEWAAYSFTMRHD
jgi:hypothetical protein